MSYIQPQVEITQTFEQLPSTVTEQLNTCVIGANYRLFRYSEEDERALCAVGSYDAASDTDVAYPSLPAGSTVDQDYVSITMESIWARYAQLSATALNPIVLTASSDRTRLHAAPQIADPGLVNDGSADTINGVTPSAGGHFRGGATLPESYYFTGSGGANAGGTWAAGGIFSDLGNSDDAKFAWRSTEGLTGTFDALATDSPLSSGNTVTGPHGIALDLDAGVRTFVKLTYAAATDCGATNTFVVGATTLTEGTDFDFDGADPRDGMNNLKRALDAAAEATVDMVIHIPTDADNGVMYIVGNAALTVTATSWDTAPTQTASAAFSSLVAPLEVRVANAAGTSYFDIKVLDTWLTQLIDDAVDSTTQTTLTVASLTTTAAASYASNDVNLDVDLGTDTLAEVRAALTGDSDITDRFEVTTITGTSTDVAATLQDQVGGDLGEAEYVWARDAFRIRVYANDLVFATGNGSPHSSEFNSRGVKSGDRVDWSVTDSNGDPQAGTATVLSVEGEVVSSVFGAPSVDDTNAATDTGTQLVAKTGADIVTAGADNQRDFNGTASRVETLSPASDKYAGDYTAGVLAEVVTATISSAGAAGTALATVRNAGGNYYRESVPVEAHPSGDADRAAIYLGQNLVLELDKGSGDADATFKVGDSWTFSTPLAAPWTAVAATDLTISGTYRGGGDTVYTLEVVRGGLFDRVANVFEGLATPSASTLTYTGQPVAAETVTLGNIVFEFDDDVTIGADADATYANLVTAVNASAARIFATQNTTDGTVTVTGPDNLVTGGAVAEAATNVTLASVSAALSVVLDWQDGDVDDEYIIKVKSAGTLTAAVFTVESLRGDDVTTVQFAADGSGGTRTLGSSGLSGYFTTTGSPTFSVGDYWAVRVNGSRPQVRVSDTAGLDETTTATVDDAATLTVGQFGLTVEFADNDNDISGLGTSGGLVKGDVFRVAATAAGAGPLTVLVLDSALPATVTAGSEPGDTSNTDTTDDWVPNLTPNLVDINLHLPIATSEIASKREGEAPLLNWEATADDVTLKAGATVTAASWTDGDGALVPIPVVDGEVFIGYRALDATYANQGLQSVVLASEVQTILGKSHPDNPLALHVYTAALNSGGQPVYFQATPTDDLAGYNTTLDRLTTATGIYGIVPCTTDTEVVDAVVAHADAMSAKAIRRWRVAMVSSDYPTQTATYTSASNGDSDWTATVLDDPTAAGTQYTLLETANGTPAFVTDVAPGDEVRINYGTDGWGDATYDSYTVAEVRANSQLALVAGPDSAIGAAVKFEIHRVNSVAQVATAVAAQASRFLNRRVIHVPSLPAYASASGPDLGGTALAAKVAGLTSTTPPQQGLTRSEIIGIYSIPSTYSMFSLAQLNEMAAGGNMLIVQDAPGTTPYIRHQVTTAETTDILEREFSVTRVVDVFSYALLDILSPFIGRYNISPELLEVLETRVQNTLNYYGSDQVAVGALSPMINLDGDTPSRILTLRQHATVKDAIELQLELQTFLPANRILVDLLVTQADIVVPETIALSDQV